MYGFEREEQLKDRDIKQYMSWKQNSPDKDVTTDEEKTAGTERDHLKG